MEDAKNYLTLPKLKNRIGSILSDDTRTTKLTNDLENVTKYKDVLYHMWKILMKGLQNKKNWNDITHMNILELLEVINLPKTWNGKEVVELGEEDVIKMQGAEISVIDVLALKKCIRKVWQLLINRNLSLMVHKKTLIVLVESYLSNLYNPIFLTDFLMASMNIKGVIGILALQGIATLMQKHNIEYPNVYEKLYTMFDTEIFHTKYKSRLFHLANIFLSSTHLPERLVASFAKRASRLGLMCAPPDAIVVLRFVGNLLLRHTGLKKMIHYPSEFEVSEDPFLMSENDPMKTRASESSLWELNLLNRHSQPSVSSAAKFIYSNLPSLEFDLAEALNEDCKSMFESECKKRKQKVSVTFERPPDKIAKLRDDHLFKMWSLTT